LTQPHKASFLSLARDPSVVKRAGKIALIVGAVLALINHGDKLFSGGLALTDAFKIVLTFAVPYCVSTYSSVLAIRERMQSLDPE
jgi:hypothetical protein